VAVAEDYVRPPIVALDRRSQRGSKWRFRAVILVVLAAVAVAVFLIARSIIDSGEGNAQAAPHQQVAPSAVLTAGNDLKL
jgi:hypothetical protein